MKEGLSHRGFLTRSSARVLSLSFLYQKKTVLCPIDGKVIPMEQLPDETFATGILGPGCGVEPTGDTV